MKPPRLVDDLSNVKAYGFGYKSLWGWGLLGFMLVEGMAFVLAFGAYLYLMMQAQRWPLNSPPPDLLWGTVFTITLIVSQWPNFMLDKASHRRDARAVKRGMLLMTLLGVVLMIIRVFEFAHLNVRWDADAYGSIVWALMLLHTVHVLTDLADTAVLAVFVHTHPLPPERFSHVEDNASYWLFVVICWLPIYTLVYWIPRWMP
jgi:heme/copper-type cytochrome/quinol oxidase subunit 3